MKAKDVFLLEHVGYMYRDGKRFAVIEIQFIDNIWKLHTRDSVVWEEK
jgi:hypothetical protein